MSSNRKAAIAACAVMLPILFGVGFIADVVTRAAMMGMFPENMNEFRQSLLPGMVWVLLGMWAVTSTIVISAANIIGPRRMMTPPPPPPYRKAKMEDEGA